MLASFNKHTFHAAQPKQFFEDFRLSRIVFNHNYTQFSSPNGFESATCMPQTALMLCTLFSSEYLYHRTLEPVFY